MAGKKGMKIRRARSNTARYRIWQSMRIMRRFTMPDLCRASDARLFNVRKFVDALVRHGYIAKNAGYVSGRAGVYQSYRIVRDTGPYYPTRCDRCGRPIGEKCDKIGGGS